ncbi:pilus assembly protein [Streptomyces griseoincarnatus]|uniref:Pilus assembly protein n=1 Tax=Streptomyces griseoincarnatus TaxID=29305 RepID=A0ABT0VTC5_STRGI|nr:MULTISPECIES: TadE/TadG family type IV pilus assembly protein [Streptomyces]MBJ6614966.1 pilus assembly protein [Streptomyces sp. I3(2020)]MBJ6625360.1 pilus assembly protein [Streptomyces sp. I4(2020)]MCM2513158.1 pilus assembly protein [Streptomyces griseoincarnatus]
MSGGRRARATGPHRDRGQVTVEFLGMTPTILVTLVVLWQLVLVGYTFTLAGNAADEAARAGTAASRGARQGACQAAGTDKLSGAWGSGATVTCATGGGMVTADVTIRVPILFPGTLSFPFDVTGHAGAVEEETD